MKLYLSGIGGIGLSAYASHMRLLGHEVFGSDKNDSGLLNDLRSQGIHVSLDQSGVVMPENIDLFVYSEAIPENSPEREEALRRGIRQISYFQALGELTAKTDLIAVCGTHGKSSTTAMAIEMLIRGGADPSAVVGTKVPQLGNRNWRKGRGKTWIVEACEYRRSFRFLQPQIILLTNADGDHFDAFANLEDYRKAFVEFIERLPKDGIVIAHGSDPQSMDIVRAAKKTFIDADGFSLPTLSVPGLHMQKNAQLVLALAKAKDIKETTSIEALKHYKGSWRRMEVKGEKNGVTIIDDYAHHPTEIRATIAAMKSAYPTRRIVAIFQPHTHDRTLKLWNGFAEAFEDADCIVLSSVYDARPDKDSEKADEKKLSEAIADRSGKPCTYAGSPEDTSRFLLENTLKSGDIALVMGAGDSTRIAEQLLD